MEINKATFRQPSGLNLPPVFAVDGPDPVHACKIFIIDNEEPNLVLFKRILMRAGYHNLISTTDSREAAALFSQAQPDFVVTDWLMPEVDGCAVIEQLRLLPTTDDYLPIIVLTADATWETRKRALAAGATDVLRKPFDRNELLGRMRNMLQTRLFNQKQNAAL